MTEKKALHTVVVALLHCVTRLVMYWSNVGIDTYIILRGVAPIPRFGMSLALLSRRSKDAVADSQRPPHPLEN